MNTIYTLTITATLALFGGVLGYRKFLLPISLAGLLTAFVLNFMDWDRNQSFYNNMFMVDNFNVAFTGVAIVLTFLLLILVQINFSKTEAHLAEVHALILYSLVGVVVMTGFMNLVMLFLGIEILSLALYVLAGLRKKDLKSNEAALKYFLMGGFSTAFFLFGVALIYGVTGSFDLKHILEFSANAQTMPGMMRAGLFLIYVGLFFKIAIIPFHFWTPDVYEGAPTLVTAYMATVGKLAAVAALIRFVMYALVPAWHIDFWTFSAVTMLGGNIIAVYQNNMKRMLAYSSIAHAGYMLMALAGAGQYSVGAALVYTASYGLASLVAFAVVNQVESQYGDARLENFGGMFRQRPAQAIAFGLALLSLAGIPPLAGFFAKFYMFSAAMNGGHPGLVIIGVVSSAIGVVYYFRPLISAWMNPLPHGAVLQPVKTIVTDVVLWTASMGSVIIGVYPTLLAGLL